MNKWNRLFSPCITSWFAFILIWYTLFVCQEHEEIILKKFGEDGRTWVDFLLYICYIPLFVEIHGTITDNPLDDRRNKWKTLPVVVVWLVVCMYGWMYIYVFMDIYMFVFVFVLFVLWSLLAILALCRWDRHTHNCLIRENILFIIFITTEVYSLGRKYFYNQYIACHWIEWLSSIIASPIIFEWSNCPTQHVLLLIRLVVPPGDHTQRDESHSVV